MEVLGAAVRMCPLQRGLSPITVLGAGALAAAAGSTVSVGLAQLTDTEPAEQCDYKPVSEKLLMEHFRTLREKGVVVIDDALSADELEAVRHDLKAMESELSCAGFDRHIRSDSLLWVREEDVAADSEDPVHTGVGRHGLLHAVRLLRGLGAVLEQCYQGDGVKRPLLVPKQCQWARCVGVHEKSPRTVVHRDALTKSFIELGLFEWLASAAARHRGVTAILFLNGPNWDTRSHAGALRCYIGAEPGDQTGRTATEVLNVDPIGGRLVLYDARAVPHEEIPTDQVRDSLTIWILDAKAPGSPPPPGRGPSWTGEGSNPSFGREGGEAQGGDAAAKDANPMQNCSIQ